MESSHHPNRQPLLAQAATLPEVPPLDTTSPLAASAVAPAFDSFSTLKQLAGLTQQQQEVFRQLSQSMSSPRASAAHARLNGSPPVKQEPAAAGLGPAPHVPPPFELAPAAQQQAGPFAGAEALQLRDPALLPVAGTLGQRRLRDPSLKPVSGTIGHRRGGRGGPQPVLAEGEVARPKRTVRRPARRFDDDFEAPEADSDEVRRMVGLAGSAPPAHRLWQPPHLVKLCPAPAAAALFSLPGPHAHAHAHTRARSSPQDYVPSEREEPASPHRHHARPRPVVASLLSPTTQAAVTMASLLGPAGGAPQVLPGVRAPKREESPAADDDPIKDPDVTPEGLSTRSTQRRAPIGGCTGRAAESGAAAAAAAPADWSGCASLDTRRPGFSRGEGWGMRFFSASLHRHIGQCEGPRAAHEPPAAIGLATIAPRAAAWPMKTMRRKPSPFRFRAAPLPVHVPATAAVPAGAPRVGGNRRNAPTPASTGLPARTILVAKRLTNR